MADQKTPRRKRIDPDDLRMSFGDHLEELRTRLILSLVGLVAATIVCLIFNKHVISFVLRPAFVVLRKYGQEPALQSLSPPDTFMIWIKIALLCGVVLSSPWLIWQMWQFVASGLYEVERRYVRWFGLASPVLFLVGVTFMFFVVLPIVLNFFASLNQSFPVPGTELTWLEELLVGPQEVVPESPQAMPPLVSLLNEDPQQPPPGTLWFNQTLNQLRLAGVDRTYQMRMRPLEDAAAVSSQYSIDFYVSFILTLSLAFGVAFQLPIVVIFLSLSGIVSVEDLARARKYVIFGIVIASALLTPPDVFSQILLAIPMAILYEGGLIVSRMMLRSRAD
ncbi:MAG: twin-arginine translocase subunit TatC [Planctomycetes bacterium]|nr:twin-arginine translocase subunit TatC [Planctomycetota bacterium]